MRVGIVGAGMTGLAAARRLEGQGHHVVLVDEGGVPGGRVSTRRTHGCLIDDGAQYLRLPHDYPETRRLVLENLPTEGLIDIGRPVWTFDRSGVVRPGDADQNSEPKWTYREGLSALGVRLSRGLDVRFNRRVASVARSLQGYALVDAAGVVLTEADRVLMTCPAPRAREFLRAGNIEDGEASPALEELERVRYRPIVSIALGYPASNAVFRGGTPHDPRPYYALVNTDRAHPISWLACENDKGPDRVPPEVLALVAQMSGPWSAAHAADTEEQVARLASTAVSDLLGIDLHRPLWHDVTRWRYALPDSTCDLAALNRGRREILLAGDYVAGGRIHLALQAGLDAASMLGN